MDLHNLQNAQHYLEIPTMHDILYIGTHSIESAGANSEEYRRAKRDM